MLTTLSLSSYSLLSSCTISSSFIGIWIQPGLIDLITINNTWFSLKGTCLHGQQDIKYKYIYYNEQTRCKRCILFIPRHSNALQYRESECFDADDDDNSRICGSITPDTVLYTLFRDNAEPIPCPFDQIWYFKKSHQISSLCQPKAFHNCLSLNTFQILYNNRCQSNKDITAICIAQFSDGNMNYIISRNLNQRKFICFSYTKTKINEKSSLPNEVYLSEDETCRSLLTRESALILNVLSNKYYESKVQMPDWTQGIWLSIRTDRINTNTFLINQSQLIMKMNDDQIIKYDLKFQRIIQNQQQHEKSIYIRAKSLEQCSSIFYCIKLIYRSSAVIDLSIGFDEHQCKENHIHYTLFKPMTKSNISCPQIGIYKSLNPLRSPLPISTCSIGLWSLSIGCQRINPNELTLTSSCRHDIVPDVQVITSIKGICLASWRTDHRFQRTMILYDKTKAFCLIQPLKSMTASWILSETSCTNIGLLSINVENSLRYIDNCQNNNHLLLLSSSSSNIYSVQRIFYLLFYLTMKVLIFVNVLT
ncbi:unnamed protein product [Rotaria sp. Silwood1]|nr:unnamed protein product [Rotaria sp. Silwood1]CAF1573338.1 unnamed protein product [Rotaria sp. Silwood1]CAF3757997.1 unnamed protein product [Rotaria sp. Silwood1]CAF4806783.1 unnamed protein product [Rotaria sp. Silwood1]